jgi:DNA-binding GntR family transcriptional regulator
VRADEDGLDGPDIVMPQTPSIAEDADHSLSLLSNRDRVVSQVRRQIVRGDLLPGDRITEWDVANALGVSRGPVREGLRELEREGLVQSLRNRGAIVMGMTDEELLGLLLPIRLTIERFAAVAAIERSDPAHFDELEAIVDRMESAAQAHDTDLVTDLDLNFHRRVIEASEQQHAMHLWQSIYPRIQAQLHRIGRGRRTSLTEIPGEHRLLLQVLINRDRDGLAAALEAHIIGDAQAFLPGRLVDEHGAAFDLAKRVPDGRGDEHGAT